MNDQQLETVAAAEGRLPADFICPACGYDLSGAKVERCSECGYVLREQDIERNDRRRRLARKRLKGWLRVLILLIVIVAVAIPFNMYPRHPELAVGVVFNSIFFLLPILGVGWWATRRHSGMQRRLLRKAWLGFTTWIILPIVGVAILSRIRLTIDASNQSLSTTEWSGLYTAPAMIGAVVVFLIRDRLWSFERRRMLIDDVELTRRRFNGAVAISCAVVGVPPMIGLILNALAGA